VVAARVDVIGAVSEYEARLARSVGARHVVRIHNGIPELDAPPPSSEPAQPPEVVAVGRLDPARRPLAAAEILAAVRDVARVQWVGGPTDGPVADRMRAAGVEPTGWLAREEVLDRLGRATACLHWSAWDSQPLAVLEAMARDAVVVASDIPANRELLGPAQVCDGREAAARALRRVVSDDGHRAALLNHQRAVRAGYSAREMVRRWIELYAATARHAPGSGSG